MQKVHITEGDKRKIIWNFPISDPEPKHLQVTLSRTSEKDGTDMVYVKIEGIKRPTCALPDNGPCYIGYQTKDPILYKMAQGILDEVEDETKKTVTFSHAGLEEIKRGLVISKDYNLGSNTAFFKLVNWSWDNPRMFAPDEADKLFARLESVIDARIPDIESQIAECVKNRPALMERKFAIDDPAMHEEAVTVAAARIMGVSTKQYRDMVERARNPDPEDGLPPRK